MDKYHWKGTCSQIMKNFRVDFFQTYWETEDPHFQTALKLGNEIIR